ncbi:hypothetical protein FH608_030320 [Nonomuraea phyllanthi]|uniref:Uncharacterized protein n=1 Tax=Nonomuraea phyllanthi TaxID=2219224 RepID=A0A5C4W1Y3_9ACTN|nr:DUF5947 family protein [Nonomuraea phyllanthi]KAB8191548.1 hypothetical protein FH608_030320 [Nonomuraea phyllanthi]
MSGRLRELATRPRERAQRCELCAEPLPDAHRHLLELPARELRCACRACQLLFDHGAAGGGHYRLVPERRLRLSGARLDEETWAGPWAPVRTVFVIVDSTTGLPVQHYPSPAGAVRAPLDRPAWDRLREAYPVLGGLEPDVEALLSDRDHGAWIVPVDDCYALVGALRSRWRGLTGGQEVRRHLTQFFTDLDGRSAGAPATGNDRSPA